MSDRYQFVLSVVLPVAFVYFAAPADNPTAHPPFPGTYSVQNGEQDGEREIKRRLAAPISVDYQDRPLRQVIEDLHMQTGIKIRLDLPALDEESISPDEPLAMKLEGVPFKSVLKLLLHNIRLTYTIKDGGLLVTTNRRGSGKLIQRAWPVADLLGPAIEAGKAALIANPVARAQESLRKLIVELIAPRSWAGAGGQATIEYTDQGNAVVVTQTTENLEQVDELLNVLRRLEQDKGKEELFECWYHELWEAHHDQPSWLPQFASARVLPVLWHLPAVEPARFLAAIANNPQVPIASRRECVLQLFRRHVRPGMKLSELAGILHHPSWLRPNHVTDWKQAAGSFFIGVAITDEDSTFSVQPFPEHDQSDTIYLRVSGKMTKENFVKILRESKGGGDASILELSFCPP